MRIVIAMTMMMMMMVMTMMTMVGFNRDTMQEGSIDDDDEIHICTTIDRRVHVNRHVIRHVVRRARHARRVPGLAQAQQLCQVACE